MNLAPVDDALLALGALAAAALAIWKVIIPAIRAGRGAARRVSRMLDVVGGTPAVPDPDHPGEYLRPGTPDMGVRMTAVEDKLDVITAATITAAVEHAARTSEQARLASEQARLASEHAARDSRRALDAVGHLRAASEVWHASEIDVLHEIESRVTAAHPDTTTDQEGPS